MRNLAALLALTFTTGVVDAVGFLGLDRVFTGNMTGNVVVLGMGIAGADDLPVLGPALALVGFMVGAALGGRVLKRSHADWTTQVTVLLGLVGIVLLGLGVVVLVTSEPGRTAVVALTTTIAALMGVQAAAARFLAVKDVTTVVVTSTITGLAADSWFGSGAGGATGRRALAVVLILTGALVGALLLRVGLGVALLLPGVVVVGVVAVTAVAARRAVVPA
jgi:uncharacterized membrane protein YoaK (UPF0700 family)